MARGTKRRSTRKDPSLNDGTRAVELRESRRFFSSQGNDKATREARALQNLVGAGGDLAGSLLEKQNVEGGEEALGAAASGAERDAENKNKGYIEMWDSIEAENDLATFSSELPEVLTDANWEDLEEDQAVALMDVYYQKQIKGIDMTSVYGQKVGAGIIEQGRELVAEHKDMQLAKHKKQIRSGIHTSAMNTYKETGAYPYEEVARRTNVGFDGPEKMETWIGMLSAAAVELEDEDIITNAITHFENGDPSGINDPRFMPDLEIAKGKARAARARTEEKARAARVKEAELLRTDGRLDLQELTFEGIDPTVRAIEMARDGIIKPEDVTSASSNYRTSRDDRAQHGANPELVMQMTTLIAIDPNHDVLSAENILGYWSEGGFGPPESPESQSAARAMINDVETAKRTEKSLSADPRKAIWTSRFDKTFAPETNQFGGLMSDNMTEIRAEYSAEFKLAILNATSDKEYRELWEDYSTRYAKQETLVNAKANAGSPAGVFREFHNGRFTVEQAAAQARSLGYTAKTFRDARKGGELGGRAFTVGTSEDLNYIAILTEMRKKL